MTITRKDLLFAGGYAAFFVAAFLVSLMLTFNPSMFIPLVQNQAAQRRIHLVIKRASLSGLMGLELREVEIAPLSAAYSPGRSFVIDRLTVSPRLISLPAILIALARGQNPPLAFSFAARLGEGAIKGAINQQPPSLDFSAKVQKLPLERITILGYYLDGLQLTGTMNAEFKLKVKDQKLPETWTGNFLAELTKPTFSDFKIYGVQVAGFGMDKGTLAAEIKSGAVNITSIKLTGGEIPTDLTGTIALKSPLGRSLLELKGAIQISDDYKTKFPFIAQLIPSPNPYSYRTTLDALFPGL